MEPGRDTRESGGWECLDLAGGCTATVWDQGTLYTSLYTSIKQKLKLGSRGNSSGKQCVPPPAPWSWGPLRPPNPSSAALLCSGRYSAPARGHPPARGPGWVFMCVDHDAEALREWFMCSTKLDFCLCPNCFLQICNPVKLCPGSFCLFFPLNIIIGTLYRVTESYSLKTRFWLTVEHSTAWTHREIDTLSPDHSVC